MSDNSYEIEHRPASDDDGAPLWDLTKNGIYPKDVYGPNGLRYFSVGDPIMDQQAYSIIKLAHGRRDKMLKVYRAVPKGVKTINEGDWVTIIRDYAKGHAMDLLGPGKDGVVISKTVNARDLFTDGNSWLEWGYVPQARTPRKEREPWEKWPGKNKSMGRENPYNKDGNLIVEDPNEDILVYHATTDVRGLINGFDTTTIRKRIFHEHYDPHSGMFVFNSNARWNTVLGFGPYVYELKVPISTLQATNYAGHIPVDSLDTAQEKFPQSKDPLLSLSMSLEFVEPQALLLGQFGPESILRVYDRSSNEWFSRSEFLENYNKKSRIDKVRDLGFNVADYTQSYQDILSNISNALDVSPTRILSVLESAGIERFIETLHNIGFPQNTLSFYEEKLSQKEQNMQMYYEGDFFMYEIGNLPLSTPLKDETRIEVLNFVDDLRRKNPDYQESIMSVLESIEGSDDFEDIQELANQDVDYVCLSTGGGSFESRVLVRSKRDFQRFLDFAHTNIIYDHVIDIAPHQTKTIIARKGKFH